MPEETLRSRLDNNSVKREQSPSGVLDKAYWVSLAIALAGILYDETAQELIREEVAKGNLHLNEFLLFFNDNFVGDIGNAFGFVFAIPLLTEVINWEVQKSQELSEQTKKVSEFASLIAPFAMAVLFLAGAIDGETSQRIFKWGTPDKLDLVGAVYGTAVALVSILKLRDKVFPRKNTK